MLDDAAGSDQVRPLLPGSAGCLVLVTSRRRLTALEEAAPISLGTLPPGEAADLFVRLAAARACSPQMRGRRGNRAVRLPAAGDPAGRRQDCAIILAGRSPTWPLSSPPRVTGWRPCRPKTSRWRPRLTCPTRI